MMEVKLKKKYGHWFCENLIDNKVSLEDDIFFILNIFNKKLNKNEVIKESDLDVLKSICRHINGNVGNEQENAFKSYLEANKNTIVCTYKEEIIHYIKSPLLKNKTIFFFYENKLPQAILTRSNIIPFKINLCKKYNDLSFGKENTLNIVESYNKKFYIFNELQLIKSAFSLDYFYLKFPEKISSLDVAQKILSNIVNNKTKQEIIYCNSLLSTYFKRIKEEKIEVGSEKYLLLIKQMKKLKFLKAINKSI